MIRRFFAYLSLCVFLTLMNFDHSWALGETSGLDGRAWYVDSDAPSGGNGVSWDTAWNSFSEIVWGRIEPGDTIFLSGGESEKTYTGSLVVHASGESDRPITITRGQDKGHAGVPILDGEFGPTNWYGIDIGWAADAQSYVVVSHLRLQHFASAGLSARYVTAGVVFEHNEVICGTQTTDSPRGIDVRWSQDVVVRNNVVTAPTTTPAQTDGIYLQGNQRFLVEGNSVVISNRNGEGHSDALQLIDNGQGTIRNNLFVGPEAGEHNHTVVIEAQQDGTQLLVYNNVCVIRGDLYNFMIFRNLPSQPQGNIRLFNNTIYNGARALSIESYANVAVRNNIIYSSSGQHLLVANGPPPRNFSHNLVGVDAKWIAPSDLDFRLAPDSPAIDAGTALREVTHDFSGVPRPQGTAYDIGAFEFVKN